MIWQDTKLLSLHFYSKQTKKLYTKKKQKPKWTLLEKFANLQF